MKRRFAYQMLPIGLLLLFLLVLPIKSTICYLLLRTVASKVSRLVANAAELLLLGRFCLHNLSIRSSSHSTQSQRKETRYYTTSSFTVSAGAFPSADSFIGQSRARWPGFPQVKHFLTARRLATKRFLLFHEGILSILTG